MENTYGKGVIDTPRSSVITWGTSAETAYQMYREKQEEILKLQYESDILIDKYHYEMRRAPLPFELGETFIKEMFTGEASRVASSQALFSKTFFSQEFLDTHKITFIRYYVSGLHHTAMGIVLGIGDYEYAIECPQPQNILADDMKRLMGGVKYRVDRLPVSKANDFFKPMEAVQMPTYDWKLCFEAIEQIVDREGRA